MPANKPISLWDMSAAERPHECPMDGDSTCDVAIVGGGFTGLSTALHAANLGLDCHVLEARHIGYGGSGRNVGLVNAGVWLPPQDVEKNLGKEAGSRLVQRLGELPDYVFSLIEKYQIRCEATRSGTIHAAHSPRGFQDLQRRAEGWHRRGVDVELLDAAETAKKTGTTRFFGGLLDRRAGTINPMGYARGLARAATSAGARISTGVTVTKITRAGDRWQLRTARGTVSAKYVVLGTNAYSDDLWPGLRQSFTKIHFFQLSTEPLGKRGEHILPERQGLWDTNQIMFSLRRDEFGRLIIGSMGSVLGGRKGLSRRWAQANLKRLFPELGKVEFDNAWHGQIAMTPDHLFRIHRLAEGVFTPIGYNGRGITTGTMFGKALAELMTGATEDTLPIPVTGLKPAANRTLKAGIYETAFTMNQLMKSF
ncbi:NAD(P)/FAD-dependent oxidoreductase [Paracoccus seriniphilus]|uniref:Glycine/D-amino acid oxidase n=1 Tax=Paracoccus seriniphilus TaxID=184748 RepID=A0A239Q1K1_9RHOB|nr:FAD-binding oxidoreductase [Paracoccus seriniphilus]WCR15897.1 FAD-binding oxidoreductase [Paracoccus seriniphilus]SNT76320.1 Glycine/D-amino acid oxidase [Paracoccus seriniphilus]